MFPRRLKVVVRPWAFQPLANRLTTSQLAALRPRLSSCSPLEAGRARCDQAPECETRPSFPHPTCTGGRAWHDGLLWPVGSGMRPDAAPAVLSTEWPAGDEG